MISWGAFGSTPGNSLAFDGNDDYVNVDFLAGLLANEQDFTIEFSINTVANNQNGIRVCLLSINKPGSGDNEFLIVLGETFTPGDEKLNIYDQHHPVHPFVLQSPNDITGDCHHIAYVKKGSVGEAFVDGVSIGTHQIAYSVTPNHRVSIGQDWDSNSPSDFFKGEIYNFKVWDEAKSSANLISNKDNYLSGTEQGLLAYFSCYQGKGGENNVGIDYLENWVPFSSDGELYNFSLTGNSSNWITSNCVQLCSPPLIDSLYVDLSDDCEENNVIEIKSETTLSNSYPFDFTWYKDSVNGYNVVNETESINDVIPEVEYFLVVSTKYDSTTCSDTSRAFTYTEEVCIPQQVIFPNILTQNSPWFPMVGNTILNEELKSSVFKVYNRWGLVVYESNEGVPELDWLVLNRKNYSSGAYFWIWKRTDQKGSSATDNGFFHYVP